MVGGVLHNFLLWLKKVAESRKDSWVNSLTYSQSGRKIVRGVGSAERVEKMR